MSFCNCVSPSRPLECRGRDHAFQRLAAGKTPQANTHALRRGDLQWQGGCGTQWEREQKVRQDDSGRNHHWGLARRLKANHHLGLATGSKANHHWGLARGFKANHHWGLATGFKANRHWGLARRYNADHHWGLARRLNPQHVLLRVSTQHML